MLQDSQYDDVSNEPKGLSVLGEVLLAMLLLFVAVAVVARYA